MGLRLLRRIRLVYKKFIPIKNIVMYLTHLPINLLIDNKLHSYM